MTMKFRAHDTFFIRKGWLSKGMERVVAKDDLFVDKNENPMDVLGIGSNMVKALRYWLQTVGLTKEATKGKRVQNLTPLGHEIFANDKFIEELGTLYLLQYQLAKQEEEATAWYYFFNVFSMSEFTREEFVQGLQNYILMSEDASTVAIRSLNDDFACIINTYLPRYKSNPGKVSPENNIDCPFGELGLVDIANKKQKTYKEALREEILPGLFCASNEESGCHACMSRQLTNAATTRKLVFEWKEVSTCLIEVTCRVNILAVQHLFRTVRCIVMSTSNYIRVTEHMQASVGMVPSGNVREESS